MKIITRNTKIRDIALKVNDVFSGAIDGDAGLYYARLENDILDRYHLSFKKGDDAHHLHSKMRQTFISDLAYAEKNSPALYLMMSSPMCYLDLFNGANNDKLLMEKEHITSMELINPDTFILLFKKLFRGVHKEMLNGNDNALSRLTILTQLLRDYIGASHFEVWAADDKNKIGSYWTMEKSDQFSLKLFEISPILLFQTKILGQISNPIERLYEEYPNKFTKKTIIDLFGGHLYSRTYRLAGSLFRITQHILCADTISPQNRGMVVELKTQLIRDAHQISNYLNKNRPELLKTIEKQLLVFKLTKGSLRDGAKKILKVKI